MSAEEDTSIICLGAGLSKAYEFQFPNLGQDNECQTEGRVFNGIFKCIEGGWEVEDYLRHVELLVEQLGLTDEKGVSTPDMSGSDEEDTEHDVELDGDDVTWYEGLLPGAITSPWIAQIAFSQRKKDEGK